MVVVKAGRNRDTNLMSASPTPAITKQKARMSKRGNDDPASRHEIDSEGGKLENDTFLEEISNTPMESPVSSEDSSDESIL